MILEESKHTRNHRIAYRLAFRIFAAVMTIGIIAMDMYVTFSSTVAHLDHAGVTLDIGPVMTKLCHNTTHRDDRGLSRECITILFYQLPIDDYTKSSAMMMLSLWIPILAGLILTRLTFWKVHTFLQVMVSMGYAGVVYILLRDGYSLGISVEIIACRLVWSMMGVVGVVAFIVYKCCREKYCLGISDEPTLIGVAYSDNTPDETDDDDDVLSAGYWRSQKRFDE